MNIAQYNLVDLWAHMAYKEAYDDPDLNTKVLERQIGVLEEEINELEEAFNELDHSDPTLDYTEVVDAFCDITWVGFMIASLSKVNPFAAEWPHMSRKDLDKEEHAILGQYRTLCSALLEEIRTDGERLEVGRITNQIAQMSSIHINDLIYKHRMENPFMTNRDYGHECFTRVIESNFSKVVSGELPKDETGKVSKQEAINAGTYIEPCFNDLVK